MKNNTRAIGFSIVLAVGGQFGAWAQLPAIYPRSVLNAASFFAPGLPAGAIARGSIFSIFGTALGPSKGVQVSAFPLQNTFNGVSITVTQAGTSINAIPLYVSAGQINAVMPSDAPLGWVSLRVTYNNALSNPSPVYVVTDSVGIFTSTGTGLGPGAIHNFVSAASQPPNSTTSSAKPGQVVTLFATGLGPITTPDNQAPPSGSLSTPVEVWVGGVPATVSYSGRSPCCAGLDQVSFTVPTKAPQGCWVPVEIRTSHANVSNFVSMAIEAKGGACADSFNPVAGTVVKGGALGLVQLMRLAIHEDVGVNAPIDLTSEQVTLSATKQPGGAFAFSPFLSPPPPGTCTVYPGVGDYLKTQIVPQTSVPTLDAGTSLTVSGPGGQQKITLAGGAAPLGSFLPLYDLPNQLYLNPGSYKIEGAGGTDVKSFQTSLNVPNSLTWTNRDETTTVNRSEPLNLTWTGAPAGPSVTILGVDSDLGTNSSALFLCTAAAGADSFTVPAEVLEAIPASRVNPLASKAVIYVIATVTAPFSASGLNQGLAAAVYLTGKTVIFR